MTRRRTITGFVLLAVMTMTTTACVAGGSSSESPDPSSSSPQPSTAEPTPSAVVITAEEIAVLDPTGAALASFDYFQPTGEVVEGLSAYLGPPVDSPNPGGLETPPGIDHVWGGLRLFDTDPPGASPDNPNHYVFVDGPDAGTLPVATAPGIGAADGVGVGDPASTLTIGVEAGVPHTDPATGRTSVVDRIGLVALPTSTPATPLNFAVMVVSYTDDGMIARLVAPSANFGV